MDIIGFHNKCFRKQHTCKERQRIFEDRARIHGNASASFWLHDLFKVIWASVTSRFLLYKKRLMTYYNSKAKTDKYLMHAIHCSIYSNTLIAMNPN